MADIVYIDLNQEFIDRYSLAKFIDFNNGVYSLVNSYFLYQLEMLPPIAYYRVTAEIMRADTISYNLFSKNEEFWWLILYYNKIIKFQDLVPGMILKIFSIDALEKKIDILNTKQQLLNQDD